MAQGFGIAAIVIVIISYFVPVVGIFGTGIAMVLAAIAALAGDKGFTIATVVLGTVNTFFLSPSVWGMLEQKDSTVLLILFMVFLALPLVGMFLHASGKLVPGQAR